MSAATGVVKDAGERKDSVGCVPVTTGSVTSGPNTLDVSGVTGGGDDEAGI